MRGILHRILTGERAAETEFVEWFEPRIRAYVSSRIADAALADDIVQDTLMAALCATRDGKVREPDALAGFVFGVARNQTAEAIRCRYRHRTESLRPVHDVAAPTAETEPELMQSARREIAALEPVDRKILWLTLIDGFKPGEVAAQIGLNAEAVRQRKSRALRKVVDRLRGLAGRRPVRMPENMP